MSSDEEFDEEYITRHNWPLFRHDDRVMEQDSDLDSENEEGEPTGTVVEHGVYHGQWPLQNFVPMSAHFRSFPNSQVVTEPHGRLIPHPYTFGVWRRAHRIISYNNPNLRFPPQQLPPRRPELPPPPASPLPPAVDFPLYIPPALLRSSGVRQKHGLNANSPNFFVAQSAAKTLQGLHRSRRDSMQNLIRDFHRVRLAAKDHKNYVGPLPDSGWAAAA